MGGEEGEEVGSGGLEEVGDGFGWEGHGVVVVRGVDGFV